ncbi:MAG: 50S ribosomal protein L9 [Candidatus Ratteibacteria bacterium]|nr:50S ribosomal protein L9 [Candidatus Ratteibacteria bacterium]
MKLILIKDVENLGQIGDIVNVKEGYARNYLIPKKLVLEATKANEKIVEKEKIKAEQRKKESKKAAEELCQQLEKLSLTAPVQVGENDKLYGSVTSQDISDLLKKEGFDIDKRKIELPTPIKVLGIYSVKIKLDSEITATTKVWVVKM